MNEPAYEYYRTEIGRGDEPAKPPTGSTVRGIRFSKIPTAPSEVRIFDRAGTVVLFNSFAKAQLATDFHAQIVDDLLKVSVLAFRAKYNLNPDGAPAVFPQPNMSPGGFSEPSPVGGAAADPMTAPADRASSAADQTPPPHDPASMHYRVEQIQGSVSGNSVMVVDRQGKVVYEQPTADQIAATRVQQAIVTDLLNLDVGEFLVKYGD